MTSIPHAKEKKTNTLLICTLVNLILDFSHNNFLHMILLMLRYN